LTSEQLTADSNSSKDPEKDLTKNSEDLSNRILVEKVSLKESFLNGGKLHESLCGQIAKVERGGGGF